MTQSISSQVTYSILRNALTSNYDTYSNILTQISSGSKLSSIADDPVATVNVLTTQKELDNISTYTENMELAQNELQELDDILDQLNDLISGTYKPLAVQAANGTYDTDSLQAMLTELEGGLETIVQLANTKYNGNYIFSGTNVKTEAYTMTTDDDGNITVTYNGTQSDGEYQRYVQTDDDTYVTINVAGESVFGYYNAENGESSGIIGTMVETINALKTIINENSTQDEISAAYDDLYSLLDSFDDNITEITTTQTKYASTYNNISMTLTSLDNTKTNLTEYLSEIKDVDLTEATTDLYSAMYAYQASMSLISQIYSTGTLLDYI